MGLPTLSQPANWIGAMAAYPYSVGLEAAMSFESTYDGLVKVAVRDGDMLYVPRRLAPLTKQDFRISRPYPALDCSGILYEEQLEVAKKSLALLTQGCDHIIEAPTGWGKSVTGAGIACLLGQTTLIVVNKQDLMDSWYDAIVNVLGVPPSQVGIAQGKQLKYEGCRIVLGMAQSLMKPGKYDNKFWEYFGFFIMDEVDVAAAECIVYIPTKVPARYRIGMTATPKRNDGKTPLLNAHFGPVMVKGTMIPMQAKILTKKTGWEVPKWMNDYLGCDLNTANTQEMELSIEQLRGVAKVMAKDKDRNNEILKFIVACYAQKRNLVVMSETLEHLQILQSLAINAGVKAEDCGQYIGELAKNKALLKTNAHKKVVFATYGMCSRGTNFPHWDALIMATPRANIKQPLGRILRKKEGKPQPVCLDLIDKPAVFQGYYYKRLKQYFEVKATVKAK